MLDGVNLSSLANTVVGCNPPKRSFFLGGPYLETELNMIFASGTGVQKVKDRVENESKEFKDQSKCQFKYQLKKS